MKRLILIFILLLMAVPVMAQDATAEPTAAATAEATPAPVVTTPPAQDVAVAGVNLVFAFVAGLGAGGLGVAAIMLLLINLVLRSPVILTAIEGLIFSRLDKEGVETVRGVGTVFSRAGELIDKVTDGKPNEPAPAGSAAG